MSDHDIPEFARQALRARPALATSLEVARAAAAEHGDPSHDLAHALRVARWTVRLGVEVDPAEALAAALFHDAVHIPKDSPERSFASTRAAEFAQPHLEAAGFDVEAQERIGSAIRTHSFSYCRRTGSEPTSPLGDALQDADRLEALGALGLYRCIATGVDMGAQLFHPHDPFAEDRELDDREFNVDHFYTKLLSLPDTMRTPGGREEAKRRVRVLEIFLAELRHELEV